jgi:hypothetical protein
MVKENIDTKSRRVVVSRPVELTAYTTNVLNLDHVQRIHIISGTYVNKQDLCKIVTLHVLLEYEINVQLWGYISPSIYPEDGFKQKHKTSLFNT